MRSGPLISCGHYAKNSTLNIAVSFLKFSLLVYFWLPRVSSGFVRAFSSCGECGPPLTGVPGLLIAVASRCAAQALGPRAPIAVARGLRCSVACGMFPQQGSNPCPLHQRVDSYPLHHHGSPSLEKKKKSCFLIKFAE